MSDLQRLTDEGAVNALKRSAAIYARRHDLDLPTLGRVVQAMVAVEAGDSVLPDWATGGAEPNPAQVGPMARSALDAMLRSPPAEGLYAAASDAIAEELSGRAQIADIALLGCGMVLALAILSKWSWSKDKGHQFAPGFPDLDKVLGKIGGIIRSLK